MKKRVLILLLSLELIACTSTRPVSSVKKYSIGETKISVIEQCYSPCHPGILFIHLHNNESTSLNVVKEYLTEIGGRLINIQNDGERLVTFEDKGEEYSFDPNRIYSSAGIDSTITILSPYYNANAAMEVSKFARSFVADYIHSSNLIVSVHNNSDNSLSVLTYKNSLDSYKKPGKTFINPAMDIDDFILTTDTSLFNKVKEQNINVVWEDFREIKDDGSLSLYAARHSIPYINIEAQHEHSEEQLRMLLILEDLIKNYRKETGKYNNEK